MARAQHEHAQPANVALKAGENLFDDAPPKVEWRDMPAPPEPGRYGEAPYDHALVAVTPDGVAETIVQWRTTRAFSRETLRFEPVGFFTERNSGGRRIGFEPLGWRRYEE
jgi:hypothetical protein